MGALIKAQSKMKLRICYYEDLSKRLDDLSGLDGEDVEPIVECIGNLIGNSVLLNQVTNGKTPSL